MNIFRGEFEDRKNHLFSTFKEWKKKNPKPTFFTHFVANFPQKDVMHFQFLGDEPMDVYIEVTSEDIPYFVSIISRFEREFTS